MTELLLRWRAGDEECLRRLVPRMEGKMRRIVHRYMRMERQGHALQTTAPVNEASGETGRTFWAWRRG